jgi:hypothetical protein
MVKLIVEILALLTAGWISGAEIGSWFGIQPLINKLPYQQQVHLEQAMLKTFGKVMPVLMPLCAIVVIVLAILSYRDTAVVMWLRILAAACVSVTIITTLTINVPINNRTSRWQSAENHENWTRMRARWHFFQGIRGLLFLVSFILLTIASAISYELV